MFYVGLGLVESGVGDDGGRSGGRRADLFASSETDGGRGRDVSSVPRSPSSCRGEVGDGL